MTAPTFAVRETAIPGCLILQAPSSQDLRGRFVKVFHAEAFRALGLPTAFPEVFYSVSRRDVIRGLHFQVPPAAQGKLVHCLAGRVLDAAVDLRDGSPTQGKHFRIELDAAEADLLYLPPGIAHGFRVLSENATVAYHVTHDYAPDCDQGIRWDSAGIDWGTGTPILSDRDREHPSLATFATPFRYGASG